MRRLACRVAVPIGMFTAGFDAAQSAAQTPQILQSPADVTNRIGSSVSFVVAADGPPPLAYEWHKDGIPLSDNHHFAGAHSSQLVLAAVASSDAGNYSVQVRNAFGFTNSAAARLTVFPWRPRSILGNLPNVDEITKRVAVSGSMAYLANGYAYTHPTANTGLRIVDISNPSGLVPRGRCRSNYAEANALALAGNRAFVAQGTSPPFGIGTVDVSNPDLPSFLGVYDTTASVQHGWEVTVSGSLVYAALGTTVQTFDATDPAHLVRLGSWTNSYAIRRLVLSGSLAYAAGSGLHVLDMSNPAQPMRIGGISPANIESVALTGSYAVTIGGGNLRVYDCTNPSNLSSKASLPVSHGLDLTLNGDLAYVACGSNGIAVVDLSNPSAPQLVENILTLGEARGLAVQSEQIFVADGPSGLTVIGGTDTVPRMTDPPQGQTISAGASAFFSVTANSSTELHYQWWFQNAPLDGATNSVLWVTNAGPAQAGIYSAVVTNVYGSATSALAMLIVSVSPRLEIQRIVTLPQLKLFGTAGFAYAVDRITSLAWTNQWFELTNFILAGSPWTMVDADAATVRYYRARQSSYAPAALDGLTIVANITNTGPLTIILDYGPGTFTQSGGGQTMNGTYTYTRTGPISAQVSDQTSSPPEVAGDVSVSQLLFDSPYGGTFINNAFTAGEPVETSIGTFQILPRP